jgi:putative restriction endonuclease
VSIRINLGSPYADGVPVPTSGGGWLLSYHQEGTDPAERDKQYTNRGLMRCISDRVPVGVLRERRPRSPEGVGRHPFWPGVMRPGFLA